MVHYWQNLEPRLVSGWKVRQIMRKLIKNNVSWVGKIDWELRKFHGDDYSTSRGSSYNSYLIEEEKTILVDTVWMPYADEFVENLASEIDLKKIDAIVCNHGEVDHSGSLPTLMALIPDTPIYCTANAVKSLKGQYHQDWNFKVVKSGDTLDIGNGKQLIFVEMRMLHWPDSMATFMTGDNILFSNDAFGQHYASEDLFNDKVDNYELYHEALKYFANIVSPYRSFLRKKLDEISALNLPIEIIATSHGIIWRDDPLQIVRKYAEWSGEYQENQIVIAYDTMWLGTRTLAEKIAEGILLADPQVKVKLYNISRTEKNDLIVEMFKAKTVVIGSPTIGNNILSSVAGFLHYAMEMKYTQKKAAAFGCYGWSGEGTKLLNGMLKEAGFTLINDGLRVNWNPDETGKAQAIELGKAIARA